MKESELESFNFLIGGEAGQGIQTMGYILTMAMAKAGYHVFADQDKESRIRGGHNFFRIRVSNQKIQAISEKVNLIVALNEETINLHKTKLDSDGVILYDKKRIELKSKLPFLNVPFEDLAQEKTKNRIMANTVAIGAALGLVNYDFGLLSDVLQKIFGKKGSKIANDNIKAAKAGYDYIEKQTTNFPISLQQIGKSKKMVINGVEAIALGALAAGCKFMSGYPMTPSTGILQYFAEKSADFNVVFEQAEDEIAAINMVLGASYAGTRAMTATSGGGFSLMVEGLSLAGMTETPAVIVIGQRVGPATGFPTRTEQGELEFAIHAGHGMFPRAVFAPGTMDEAFYLTIKAFNIAEKYQIPVIILTDTYLSDSYVTNDPFDLSKVTIERGEFLSKEEIKALGKYKYMRHKFTDSGISPRVTPGQADVLVVTDSDEHTEDGHITESAEVRNNMVKKRLKKFQGVSKEIEDPFSYGPQKAETALVCWGSTYGALREAVDQLNQNDELVKMIHFSEVWPFPKAAFLGLMKGVKRFVVVENNATGQMANLIRAETGLEANFKILKYDGRPISPDFIVNKFRGGGA